MRPTLLNAFVGRKMSRIVTFGEIMLRVATPGFQRIQQAMPGKVEVTFAGAEASIAASIAYLGAMRLLSPHCQTMQLPTLVSLICDR